MDEPWDARGTVARIVGCDPSELSYRHEFDRGADLTVYERDGQPVGRLIVAGPIAPLDNTPDRYYEIVFEGVDGSMHHFERVRDTGINY